VKLTGGGDVYTAAARQRRQRQQSWAFLLGMDLRF
jgi:hypothetical protein